MKCFKCGGKGYREEQHGLIQIGCPECNATGVMPLTDDNYFWYWQEMVKEFEVKIEGTIGTVLTQEHVQIVREIIAKGGLASFDFEHLLRWRLEQVKSVEEGLTEEEIAFTESQIFPSPLEVTKAEVVDIDNNPVLRVDYSTKEVKDDNGDGTKQADKVTRSRNTRKPTKPKKPKTKKAARSKAG